MSYINWKGAVGIVLTSVVLITSLNPTEAGVARTLAERTERTGSFPVIVKKAKSGHSAPLTGRWQGAENISAGNSGSVEASTPGAVRTRISSISRTVRMRASSISSIPSTARTDSRVPEDGVDQSSEPVEGPLVFYRPSVEPPASRNVESADGPQNEPQKRVCDDLRNVSGNSRVVFPLPSEYLYSYEDTWGAPRVQGGHEGTDLMVPSGTPEYAVTDGTLVRVAGSNKNGWNSLGGYAVMLRADSSIGPIRKGDLFYYAHMRKESSLPIGSRVEAGQVLGYAGDTGQGPEVTSGLFPPHLHLGWYDASGVRANLPSGAMNPYPLLEWLKGNGGTVTGGSDVRYCEAPQSKEPVPANGAKRWPAPAEASPAKSPDLATGTRDARPSPVVSRVSNRSGNRIENHAARRVESGISERRRLGTVRAGKAGDTRSRVHRIERADDSVAWDRQRGGSGKIEVRERLQGAKGRDDTRPGAIREAIERAARVPGDDGSWHEQPKDRSHREPARDRPEKDTEKPPDSARSSRNDEKDTGDPVRKDEEIEKDSPDEVLPEELGDGDPAREDPCDAPNAGETCDGETGGSSHPVPAPDTDSQDPVSKEDEETVEDEEEVADPAILPPYPDSEESSTEATGDLAPEHADTAPDYSSAAEVDAPAEP